MKIIHTSDWHLGKTLYQKSLIEDQSHFIFEIFLPILQKEKPDLIIIAGDIFDRQIASLEAIRLFESFVNEVCYTLKFPLLIITGNHDGAERIALGASLLKNSGLYIYNKLNINAPPIAFKDEYGEAYIYMAPYFDPVQLRGEIKNDDIKSFNSAYRIVIDEIKKNMNTNARNILVAHCFVTGATVCDSESPLYVGNSGEVSRSLFEGFDYVALGHIHSPQSCGSPVVRYSGSPLKYSFDEANHNKSVTKITLEEKGVTSVEKIPINPLRDLKIIKGDFQSIIDNSESCDNDYAYVILTDNSPIYEPMAKIRQRYPNALHLENEWLIKNGADLNAKKHNMTDAVKRKKISDTVIFEEFLTQICGVEATDDDIAAFNHFLKESQNEEDKA